MQLAGESGRVHSGSGRMRGARRSLHRQFRRIETINRRYSRTLRVSWVRLALLLLLMTPF